jgi:hypothetical protein
MVVGSQLHAPAALPPRKIRNQLYRRLSVPQVRSGPVRNILSPPGFNPRIAQLVGSRYFAIPVPLNRVVLEIVTCPGLSIEIRKMWLFLFLSEIEGRMVQEAGICALRHFTKGMAVQLLVAEKDRASSRWVAVPRTLLHTSSLNRQLILNAVIWYKCFLSIHGTVLSGNPGARSQTRQCDWGANLSFGDRRVLKCGFNKNWHCLKDILDHGHMKFKKLGNFTRWRTCGAKNKLRLRTECNRHHCLVCS